MIDRSSVHASTARVNDRKAERRRPEGEPIADALQSIERRIEKDGLSLVLVSPLGPRIRRLKLAATLETSDLVEVVEAEPTVALRAVQLSNSPFVSLGRARASSIPQAVERLGDVRTMRLLRAAVSRELAPADGVSGHLRRIWTHTIFAAIAARHLARRVGHPEPDLVHMASLFRELGTSVLVQELADVAPPLVAGRPWDGELLFDAIRQHSTRIGRALLTSIGAPERVCEIAARPAKPASSELDALVAAADEMALAYGYVFLDRGPSPGRLQAALAHLGLTPPDAATTTEEIGPDLNRALSVCD